MNWLLCTQGYLLYILSCEFYCPKNKRVPTIAYNLTENNHDYAILAPLKKCHIRIVLSVAWFEDMDPGTYYMMVMDRIRICLVLGFRFFQPFEVRDLKVGFVHARLSDGLGTPDNNYPNPTKTRRYKPEPDLTWSLRKKGSTKH